MDAAWWEQRYREHDTPWDHGAPHPALLDWLARHPLPPHLSILVPGSGRGHDARALALAGGQVTGLDLAPSALSAARSFPQGDQVTWREGSIFDPPPDLLGTFDLAVEHTCFCAIHPDRRADYVRGVHRCLKPGGHLLAIFYLNPGRESGPPFGVQPDELDRLFHSHFRTLFQETPQTTFPGREGRERMRLLVAR
ncbi:MAG: methyltransferase domain-containing protein [Verrucomicrobiia bacterium]